MPLLLALLLLGSPLHLPLLLTSGPSVLHRHHAAHVPLHVHRHDVAGAVLVSIAAIAAGRARTAEGVVAAQRVMQSTSFRCTLERTLSRFSLSCPCDALSSSQVVLHQRHLTPDRPLDGCAPSDTIHL